MNLPNSFRQISLAPAVCDSAIESLALSHQTLSSSTPMDPLDESPQGSSKTLTPQRKHRKLLKDGSGTPVWPESIEAVFVQGLSFFFGALREFCLNASTQVSENTGTRPGQPIHVAAVAGATSSSSTTSKLSASRAQRNRSLHTSRYSGICGKASQVLPNASADKIA